MAPQSKCCFPTLKDRYRLNSAQPVSLPYTLVAKDSVLPSHEVHLSSEQDALYIFNHQLQMGDSELARVGAMATEVSYLRNPYPLPDLTAEGDWVPRGPALGDKVSPADRDWDIGLNTHERLFAHHTMNSTRKHKYLRRPKEPKDALDWALSAIYVHNEDTLVPKAYVPMQPETLGRKTWRVLRNQDPFQTLTSHAAQVPIEGPLRRVIDRVDHRTRSAPAWMTSLRDRSRCNQVPIVAPQAHPSSVKLSIEGPHVDQSNPGYSRKVDGTFYSI